MVEAKIDADVYVKKDTSPTSSIYVKYVHQGHLIVTLTGVSQLIVNLCADLSISEVLFLKLKFQFGFSSFFLLPG